MCYRGCKNEDKEGNCKLTHPEQQADEDCICFIEYHRETNTEPSED